MQLMYIAPMEKLESYVIHWVNRLSFLTRRSLSDRFSDHDIPMSAEDWAVLMLLWQKGPQTPSELSAQSFRDRTTVTRQIDGMVRRDLVQRRQDENDRRRSLIEPTPHAETLRSASEGTAQSLIAQAVKDVSPEDLQTTLRTLQKLTENLSTLRK